jgi:hypothetical protein
MQTRFTTLLAIAALGTGCLAEDGDEAAEIAAALETDNGGLDMEDEAPLFGAEDDFAAADMGDVTDFEDPMATDETVTIAMDGPGAAIARVQVMWGNFPDDAAPAPRRWTGRISINRGALLVRRTIAFDELDRVIPRDDPRSVAFVSHTMPHVDGLLLVVADPTPEAADPLTLTYTTEEGELFSTTLADLVAGPVSEQFDDGSRIAANALLRPAADGCAEGFLRGRWRQVDPHHGVLMGGVADAEGNPIGHVRGIYGQRRNGEQVFFGKYIDRDGRFQGIFAGEYGEGEFHGRWIVRSGDHGVLGGEYRETLPGPRNGGHFAGRWAETSCAVAE